MQKRNNKLLLLNIKKSAQIIFVLFFCLNTFSQAKFLSGYVLDANNKPFERSNIIAKPTLANQTIKFAIARHYSARRHCHQKYDVRTVSNPNISRNASRF